MLYERINEGRIGELYLRQSEKEIVEVLAAPDDWGGRTPTIGCPLTPNFKDSSVWVYHGVYVHRAVNRSIIQLDVWLDQSIEWDHKWFS